MRGGPQLDMQDRPVAFGRRQAPPPEPVATGFPEIHSVPVEMVLYQANGCSQVTLRRWRAAGASFRRTARVWRVGNRLVAEVAFVEPMGPEKQVAVVIQLTTHLWENLESHG